MSTNITKDVYQTLRAARRADKITLIASAFNFAVDNVGFRTALDMADQIEETRFYAAGQRQIERFGTKYLIDFERVTTAKTPLRAFRLFKAIQRNNELQAIKHKEVIA